MADDSRSTWKAILGIVVVVVVIGVIVVSVAVLIYDQPSVVAVENRFGNVNASWTAIKTDLVIHNPNPIGIPLEDATTNYTIQLNGITVARATDEGIPLTVGNTTIEETTLLDNDDIPEWWETHIRNGERTHVKVTAHVETSLLGREFTVTRERTVETHITDRLNVSDTRPVDPIDTDIPLIPDTPLYVNETSASWGRVTENQTFLDLSIALYNPSAIPYPISQLEYTVSLNNVTVGHGATERAYIIPPGTERTINGTVVIDNSVLDEWWVTHLKHNQTTDVQVDVTAVIELPSGETIRLPLGPLATTSTFETDLFGTKNQTKGGSELSEMLMSNLSYPSERNPVFERQL